MITLFLTVALVHIIALMSPGPDFFFVSQTAVSRSRKEAMMGVLGITCGVRVWAGVALLGLHLIIEKMAWLHTIIMVGGGLYLCWMGYQMLRGALKKEKVSAEAEPLVELAQGGRSFMKGLLTNLANPKYGVADPKTGTQTVPHQYFNDGRITVQNVYFDSDKQWHTVLVGTTGRGPAKAIYALDITDPNVLMNPATAGSATRRATPGARAASPRSVRRRCGRLPPPSCSVRSTGGSAHSASTACRRRRSG